MKQEHMLRCFFGRGFKVVTTLENDKVRDIAKQVRSERRTKRKPWKQYELKKKFGNIPLRQPRDGTTVFRPVASLGKLWIRNNSIGYAYQARLWVGFTEEVDGDELESPQLMLFEIELTKIDGAEIGFDLARYRGEFTVCVDAKGKPKTFVKGRPSSE